MQLRDKTVVITGAGRGIGAALAHRFAVEGAGAVVVSDIDGSAARRVAAEIDAGGVRTLAAPADVSVENDVQTLVSTTQREFGPIDLFCSNAGIAFGAGLDASDDDWVRAWSVNLLPHVYAARAVIPSMMARGSGYLLNTASAAGLLTSPGDAPYATSKHAVVGLAEWIAVTYGSSGIRVSVLCPMGVRTELLMPHLETGNPFAVAVASSGDIIEPEQVADVVVAGLDAERFLILPHPEVGQMYARKASDPDRWLAGMQRTFG